VNPGDIFNHRFDGRVAAKVRYNRVVMPSIFRRAPTLSLEVQTLRCESQAGVKIQVGL
jgi:hypothetical protein